MNIEEFANSILQTAKERLSSPLTGALALSWAGWNYKAILVLLSTKKVEDKILILDHLLYSGTWDAIAHLAIAPMLTAFAVIGLYPLISLTGYRLWAYWQIKFREVQSVLDEGRLITKEEYERWVQESYERANRHAREIEQKNALIAELKASAEESKALISALRGDVESSDDKKAESTESNRYEREDWLTRLLMSRSFTLYFTDRSGSPGQQEMLFGKSGKIISGRSKALDSWRISEGHLELLTNEGAVYNRFLWHPAVNAFVATNDPGLLATPEQRLRPS